MMSSLVLLGADGHRKSLDARRLPALREVGGLEVPRDEERTSRQRPLLMNDQGQKSSSVNYTYQLTGAFSALMQQAFCTSADEGKFS